MDRLGPSMRCLPSPEVEKNGQTNANGHNTLLYDMVGDN
jgi:hypothetical protein